MTARFTGELELFDEWSIGVRRAGRAVELGSIDALAEFVRTDDRGRYRPLSGARTMPGGWFYGARDGEDRKAAIEAVYPLATVHSRQFKQGTLRVASLDEVLSRQSGRYENTSKLTAAGRDRARRLVCGECVRTPVWDQEHVRETDTVSPGLIPCPEPCSVLVAFCREAALWEAEPPAASEPDSAVPWAAFEEPGNELRERYLMEGPLPHD